MKYKYQLITLGSNVLIIQDLLGLFNKRLQELNLPPDSCKIINRDNFDAEYLGNQPCFVLYFGDVDGDHKDIDISEKLLKDGAMILPIYFTNIDGAFKKEIPKILENQNGILYKASEQDRIVNIALEAFELLRNTRKVFISYRRNESTSVAIQLFEALEAHNFDVFFRYALCWKRSTFSR